MDELRVRAYNVRFGDAILVTVPDRGPDGTTTRRHILIDVGNVLAGTGGQDQVFEPVIENILQELGGEPLDLYVMTHEHMDHVQGLLWAKEKRGLEIRATHSWLTASAEPGYYDRFPKAREKRLALEQTYQRIERYFRTAAAEPGPVTTAMMINNNPRSTADCVEHLRGVGRKTTYVSRETDLTGKHPFHEASFRIWGPEEDTSVYYGRFHPMGIVVEPADHTVPGSRVTSGATAATPDDAAAAGAPRALPLPPRGVDAGAFYRLVSARERGIFDNLLEIDRAANDSSIVFLMEWRGWRLLFPGDAEERSWSEMNKRDLLEHVHFLKVGHHGSHNGTPEVELLDVLLPPAPPDDRRRHALVSTHDGTYNGVPHAATLTELRRRCDVARIGEPNDPLFVDILFPDLD